MKFHFRLRHAVFSLAARAHTEANLWVLISFSGFTSPHTPEPFPLHRHGGAEEAKARR